MGPTSRAFFVFTVALWAFFTLFYVDIVLSFFAALSATHIRSTKLSFILFALSAALLALCVFQLVIRTMLLGALPGLIA